MSGPSFGPHLPLTGWRLGGLLALLFAVNALAQVDRILPFILAESIKRDLSLTDTQIGLLTGVAFAACHALLAVPLARAADRGSPRLVLVACILLWSAMTGLGGLAGGFLVLAATRLGVAVGEAGAIPSGHALIARQVPAERRGLAIGLFSMGIPLGTMIGFVVGGLVDQHLGWRWALIGAGCFGGLAALATLAIARPTPPRTDVAPEQASFVRASLTLLAHPPFRWLVAGAVIMGFAAAPFYAFGAAFLMRTHGLTSAHAGLAFGLLQGAMGVAGAIAGGRGFDRAIRSGSFRLLRAPAAVFLGAAVTTVGALFVQPAWLAVMLLAPAMLAFAYILPWGFGAAHLVAGRGREAMASSLLVLATGLLGPALGPLVVGLISDAATLAGVDRGLAFGLLVTPVAAGLAGWAYRVADRRVADALRSKPTTGV